MDLDELGGLIWSDRSGEDEASMNNPSKGIFCYDLGFRYKKALYLIYRKSKDLCESSEETIVGESSKMRKEEEKEW